MLISNKLSSLIHDIHMKFSDDCYGQNFITFHLTNFEMLKSTSVTIEITENNRLEVFNANIIREVVWRRKMECLEKWNQIFYLFESDML